MGRLAISKVLAQHGYTADVPMPDISTKEKAQEYIGLDMEKERKAKDKIVPEWLEKRRATVVWLNCRLCGRNLGDIKRGSLSVAGSFLQALSCK